MTKDSEAQELQEVEVDLKEFKKLYEDSVKKGKKHIKYKSLGFYIDYAKYLIEYVEEKGKTRFRISKASLPKK